MSSYAHKKKNSVMSTILLWFFSIMFLVSLGIIANELIIKPKTNRDTMAEVQEVRDENSVDYLATLKAINPDIVSWIKIPNTIIDYPVLHSPKEQGYDYYLKRDYKRNSSAYGSIFVDTACGEGDDCLDVKNVILHGHNMRNGSMFARLLQYSDVSFYQTSPVITFDDAQWEVFAIIKVNTLEKHGEPFKYLQYGFASDEDFLNFVHQVRSRSLIDTPVKINEADQIMTMSTCSYEYKDFRTAVYARRLRNGEDPNIDTSQAQLNMNPLWPDCYYENHKATKPIVNDFAVDFAANKINWYDGNLFLR